jgi:DNA topoisomerase VI subunit A
MNREWARSIVYAESLLICDAVFKVLAAVHNLLRSGRSATQRELYYRLKQQQQQSDENGKLTLSAGGAAVLFASPRDVDTAVQDVVALLRVPRSSLGITSASKGAVSLHQRRG